MQRTTVPRRATLEPAERTRARTTLPKLPSPISFRISKRSSNAEPVELRGVVIDPRWVMSYGTVMIVDEAESSMGLSVYD